MHKPWEIRVNGIRPQGCEFRSFSDARAYLLRLISRHVGEMRRQGHGLTDRALSVESTFMHETARIMRERPLPNDVIVMFPNLSTKADLYPLKEFTIERREPRMYGARYKLSFA